MTKDSNPIRAFHNKINSYVENKPVAFVSDVYQSRYTVEWNGQDLPVGTKLYSMPQQERSDQKIVEQTEEIAATLMREFHRRELASTTNYRDTEDLRGEHCWQVACLIQEILTGTDPTNAVEGLDEVVPRPKPGYNPAAVARMAIKTLRMGLKYLPPEKFNAFLQAIDDLTVFEERYSRSAPPDNNCCDRCQELESLLIHIGDYAHEKSTGPTVPDGYWEIRRMAYEL